MLTRQKSCIESSVRVADVVVWGGGPTTSALAIRDDIGPKELRRRARRESDGRISARLIAIADALEGMNRASSARLAGMDRQTLRTGFTATTRKALPGYAIGQPRAAGRS